MTLAERTTEALEYDLTALTEEAWNLRENHRASDAVLAPLVAEMRSIEIELADRYAKEWAA